MCAKSYTVGPHVYVRTTPDSSGTNGSVSPLKVLWNRTVVLLVVFSPLNVGCKLIANGIFYPTRAQVAKGLLVGVALDYRPGTPGHDPARVMEEKAQRNHGRASEISMQFFLVGIQRATET
jgi:hypothetical protein